MGRALTPRDMAVEKWKTLPWGEGWSKPFGFPAENTPWFISGASASGRSSFVMQLARELCSYGTILYMNYEERVSQNFQCHIGHPKMNEVQGRFRVASESTLDELVERLGKPKSPKLAVIGSFQMAPRDYPQVKELTDRFPKKCFIWTSQEKKSQPVGGGVMKLKYICDTKVRVVGYKAYCQGRAIGEAGSYYVVWREGII